MFSSTFSSDNAEASLAEARGVAGVELTGDRVSAARGTGAGVLLAGVLAGRSVAAETTGAVGCSGAAGCSGVNGFLYSRSAVTT